LTAGYVRALTLAEPAEHRPLEAAWRAGAKVSPLVEADQWFRVVIAPLHHLELDHFLINLVAVATFGGLFARFAGTTRAALVFMTGAWVGTAVSVWLNPRSWSLGASAGAYALIGALIGALAAGSWLRSRRGWVLLAVAATLIGLQIALAGPPADTAAHAGGLVFGFAAGLGGARRERAPKPRPLLLRLALAACGLLVLVAERAHDALLASLDAPAQTRGDPGAGWPIAPGWARTRDAPLPGVVECQTNGLATACILKDANAAAGAWLGGEAPVPPIMDARAWVRIGERSPSPESPIWRSVFSVPPVGPTIGLFLVPEAKDVPFIDRHAQALRETLWSPP